VILIIFGSYKFNFKFTDTNVVRIVTDIKYLDLNMVLPFECLNLSVVGRTDNIRTTFIPSRIAGYQWGRGGSETTLSERLSCGHTGAFHSSGAIPSEGDRFEGRMQDGTVTTESSHGRMGSVGRTSARCHSGLGTCVHTLHSHSI
jgi:hypothetical protein